MFNWAFIAGVLAGVLISAPDDGIDKEVTNSEIPLHTVHSCLEMYNIFLRSPKWCSEEFNDPQFRSQQMLRLQKENFIKNSNN